MNTMSEQSAHHPALWGLPNPELQGEFYEDIPVKRAIAWVLDSILIAFICGLFVVFTAGIGFFIIGFLYLVIGFIYRVVTLSNKSATLGMRVVAIEFRNHRGERFSTGMAVAHTLGFFASVSFVLPQIISIILIMTSQRAQSLSDMVLGTAAINRNAEE